MTAHVIFNEPVHILKERTLFSRQPAFSASFHVLRFALGWRLALEVF